MVVSLRIQLFFIFSLKYFLMIGKSQSSTPTITKIQEVPAIQVFQERVADCPAELLSPDSDVSTEPYPIDTTVTTSTTTTSPCVDFQDPDNPDYDSSEIINGADNPCDDLLLGLFNPKPKQLCYQKVNTTFSEEFENAILGKPGDQLKFKCISPYLTRWSTTILPTKQARYTESNRYDQNPLKTENIRFVNEFDLVVREGNSGWVICESVEASTVRAKIYVFAQEGQKLVGDEDEVEEVRVEDLNAHLTVPCVANYPHVQAILEEEAGHFLFEPVDSNRIVEPYDPRSGFLVQGTNESEQTYRCVSDKQSIVFNLFYSNTTKKELGVSGRSTAAVSQILMYTESSLHDNKNDDDKEKRGDIYCQLNATENTDVMFLKMIRCRNPYECDWLSVCFQKCWLSHDVERQEITRTSTTAFLNNPFPTGITLCSLPQENLEIRNYYFTGLDRLSYFISDPVPRNALIKLETSEQHFFTHQSTDFLCGISTFVLISNIKFAAVYKNKTTQLIEAINPMGDDTILEFQDRGFSQRNIKINLTREMTEIVCLAPYYNSSGWISSSIGFVSKDVVLPSIDQTQTTGKVVVITFRTGEVNPILHCSAQGDPKPDVVWDFSNKNLMSKIKQPQSIEGESTLKFPAIKDKTFEGTYTCIARNQFGEVTQIMLVSIEDSSLSTEGLIGIICASICFLIIFALIIYLGVKYHAAREEIRDLTDEEIREFSQGICEAEELSKPGKLFGPEEAKYMGFKKEYIIDDKELIIAKNSVLGQGEYGMVYRGFLNGEAVAVKTTKSNADVSYVKAFLGELKIMAYIGDNPHIVHFRGAVISRIKERLVYCVVELCPLGNLHSYLRKIVSDKLHEETCEKYVNISLETDEENVEEKPTSAADGGTTRQKNTRLQRRPRTLGNEANLGTSRNTHDYVDWCKQIADGMDYLSQKQVIHGDLAARNVLVFKNNVMKITDFGLSRQLYGYSKYVKKQQMPLPWRWMALESLRFLEFSSQSDVWSFGITMWEIFSMGETPYPGQNWTLNFVDEISKGLRLLSPTDAPKPMYEIMMKCWNEDPVARPTFADLKRAFDCLK